MSESVHVVCPGCGAVNRVDAGRLGQGPVCGRCGGPVLKPAPVALNEGNFEKFVARTGLPVAVDFWAPWCGPCKMMAPAFEQAAGQLHPGVILAKVDTQTEQALGARFGIQSIPTTVLFKDGREAARVSGAMGASQIVQWVRSNL